MKKVLISAVACAAIANAGMFVGFDGGYAMNTEAGHNSTQYNIYNGDYQQRFDFDAWNVSLNFGAEGFVNNYFGARAFLEAVYSGGLTSPYSHFDLTGNADIIINFVSSGAVGAFAGLGVGYSYWWGGKYEQGNAPLFARTGLTFGIGKNSRIDATLKLPIIGWNLHGAQGVNQPFSVNLGYRYRFGK
ncbi:hypothetical protein [Helicobacter sp. 23-1045]